MTLFFLSIAMIGASMLLIAICRSHRTADEQADRWLTEHVASTIGGLDDPEYRAARQGIADQVRASRSADCESAVSRVANPPPKQTANRRWPTNKDFTRVCSWCNLIMHVGTNGQSTHGICPDCFARVIRQAAPNALPLPKGEGRGEGKEPIQKPSVAAHT
jgi:hypothetical protein